MSDNHTVTLTIGETGTVLDSDPCPYDPADTTRPCWPQDTSGGVSFPRPAPQPDCVFVKWVRSMRRHAIVADIPPSVQFSVDDVDYTKAYVGPGVTLGSTI